MVKNAEKKTFSGDYRETKQVKKVSKTEKTAVFVHCAKLTRKENDAVENVQSDRKVTLTSQ